MAKADALPGNPGSDHTLVKAHKKPVFRAAVAIAAIAVAALVFFQTKSTGAVIYQNTQYGFTFTLPAGWKGYRATMDQWRGFTGGSSGDDPVTRGPLVTLRHPRWTAQNPTQDIPVMVFTLEQWNAMENGKFYVSAAPIGPAELGRNERYVFALPARFDYAEYPGREEVEEIIRGNPLRPLSGKAGQN